jgi:insulysin
MTDIIPNVLKSPKDKRKAFTYELPNKLRVYIINDEEIDTTCVSMLVKIGYFQDTVPGIAHFLEHMLFNGTEKYPDEKMFSSFISKNNGYQNAYTSHDHTCYFFTISQEGLIDGLKMFGDFFISPLLNEDSVNREREAVNSEHKKNINDDGWRRQELLRAVSNEEHWFSKFGTGSNETLNIPNIAKKVRDFFETYYSSDLMTLVILAKDDIQKVKNTVDNIFSKITIKKIDEKNLVQNKKILNTPNIIKYIPIQDDERLALIWEIPYFRKLPNQSYIMYEFLCRMFGNEQKNSLNDILMEKKYITNLSCYLREIIHDKCIFCIEINLTSEGNKNKKFIIAVIIEYIELLKKNIHDNTDVIKKLYNEQVNLTKYKFEQFEKKECSDAILDLCSLINMYEIEPENVFIIESLQENFNDAIKNNLNTILKYMTPDNLVTMSSSKKYNEDRYKDRIKKFNHYGTEYFTKNKTYSYFTKNIIFAKIPKTNNFISLSNNIHDIENKEPELLKKITNKAEIYWMPNIEYNTPNICIYVKLDLNLSLLNVYTDTCIALYLLSISKEINDTVYMMQSAMYNVNYTYIDGSIYIYVKGNYEKISEVLEILLKKIFDYELISDNSFEYSKYVVKKSDKNFIYESPRVKVTDIFTKKIFDGYYNSKDRLQIIDDIQKKNTIDVFKKIISHNDITVFIAGNCTKESATEIQLLFDKIPHIEKKINKTEKLYNKIKSKEILNIINDNKIEENNSNGYFIFIDELDFANDNDNWVKKYALINILDNIISPEYFDELRTKEMYGYVVASKIHTIGKPHLKQYFYLFLVQSPNKSNKDISDRTEKFIINFKDKLKSLDKEEFEIIKNSYISGVLEKFNNLGEMASFYFSNEIENKHLKFNFIKKIANYSKNIKLQDLIEFYDEYFIQNKNILNIQIQKK